MPPATPSQVKNAGTAPPPQEAPAAAPNKGLEAFKAALSGFGWFGLRRFLAVDSEVTWREAMAFEADNEAAHRLHKRLVARLWIQGFVIAGLSFFLFVGMPFLQPIYRYVAVRPDKAQMELSSLFMPNLTNQAVLSWVATSITEIMTYGFGDFDRMILSQRNRFTDEGWDSFTESIRESDLRQAFKERQLVLTTVPTDTPLITSQGPDLDGVYQWQVEMPIVMTFSTNNNVTRAQRSVVKLVLVRVPPQEGKTDGIGIKSWILSN